MVVVRVYYQGCDVRASVATVYVTFIEWGQRGVGHSGAHQLNLRPTLVTLRVPLAHAITKHHQHLFLSSLPTRMGVREFYNICCLFVAWFETW